MHLFHIPECSIQNRNVHVSVLNGAFWDMEQVHSGIFEIVLINQFHRLIRYISTHPNGNIGIMTKFSSRGRFGAVSDEKLLLLVLSLMKSCIWHWIIFHFMSTFTGFVQFLL